MKLFTLLMICLSLSLTACSKNNHSKTPCQGSHCQTDDATNNGDGNGNNGNGGNDDGQANLLKQISAIDPNAAPVALVDKDTLISDTRSLFGEPNNESVDIATDEKLSDILNRLGGK